METRHSWIAKYLSQFIAIIGLILILISQAFTYTFLKIQIDILIANLGALFLFIGVLQWIYDIKLKNEFLNELRKTIDTNNNLIINGLESCIINSREVKELDLWKETEQLIIGIQYSPSFFKNYLNVFQERVANKKETIVLVLDSSSSAATWLEQTKSGTGNIASKVKDIENTLNPLNKQQDKKNIRILKHTRILRYSFIYTKESIWIKFCTNSAFYSHVPAFKIRKDTPLFGFFKKDIDEMVKNSE